MSSAVTRRSVATTRVSLARRSLSESVESERRAGSMISHTMGFSDLRAGPQRLGAERCETATGRPSSKLLATRTGQLSRHSGSSWSHRRLTAANRKSVSSEKCTSGLIRCFFFMDADHVPRGRQEPNAPQTPLTYPRGSGADNDHVPRRRHPWTRPKGASWRRSYER
jgi:hypothetical protein